ncbi:MAG: chemotaxis protein CheD [Vagococcus sp.]|uniref:chemotaxis protein CheD n=1 Tax=Vagococcus sp. TaxID=1933889 RepID=UPI002FC7B5C8
MSEQVKVGISDYKITHSPNELMTLGLGSCVGVVIYDERSKIGGLSHIMLPDSQMFKGRDNLKVEKFADLAIPQMVKELRAQHQVTKLVAKIAGGASMFQLENIKKSQNIGERNIVAVETILKELNVPILASHVGGNMGRSLFFNLDSLSVSVKMVNRELYEI